MSLRIVDVREVTKPIASPIRNAYIDFSKMTTSLVAVVTNVERNGRRVVGYGFNSNGRYGQGGLIRERFAPRLLRGRPRIAARCDRREPRPGPRLGRDDDQREARRPRRALGRGRHASTWRCGTRSRRSPASRCSGCWPSATAREAESARLRLCRRRLLLSGQGRRRAARRDAQLSRPRLHRREDEDRRRRRSTRTAAHRGGARRDRQQTRSSPSTPTGASTSRRRSPTPRCCATIRCSGTRRPATRSTTICRRRWRSSIRARWPPARTCSATRTRATCCATAACGPTATGCSSTARSPTACASISARSRC